MCNENVIERFKNPHNAGTIVNADAIGEVGNVKCGDIMKVYLKIKDNKIQDIKFQTYGCVAAIASTDFLCDLVKGKTLDEATKVSAKDIVKEMGDIPEIKFHCSILAHNAIKKAVDEYKLKNTITKITIK
jgi:nitrogen fixation NifU-like protein